MATFLERLGASDLRRSMDTRKLALVVKTVNSTVMSDNSSASASDSELSAQSGEDMISSGGEEYEFGRNIVMPYQNEPLAVAVEGEEDNQVGHQQADGDIDVDNLTPRVLAARYESHIPLNDWYVYFFVSLKVL